MLGVSVARVFTSVLVGLEGRLVVVETALGAGLPGLTLVGLPDAAVRESRERVRSALRQIGLPLPGRNVVVNLAPADLPKAGTSLDLAVALSILLATGDLAAEASGRTLFAGELALDGALRAVPGILSIVESARREGFEEVVVPSANGAEASAVPGVTVLPADHLGAVVAHVAGVERLARLLPPPWGSLPDAEAESDPDSDLADVRGQLLPRRALEIAAAGGHNLLLVGPPGAGKTMLARRVSGLLPPLSLEEALDVTRIWSASGRLPGGGGLVRRRPFRSPHHGASAAALAGGGSDPRPGELSLAHHGVLFLDEFAEFRRDALEALREPLEDGTVSIARAGGGRTFPARFLLVAAMNPCPCGFRGDPVHGCRCSENEVARYARKVSGPLLDRIDLHVEVPAVPSTELHGETDGESTGVVRARVVAARRRQEERTGDPRLLNSALSSRAFSRLAAVASPARDLLARAMDRLALSARASQRVLRVSRTIADLAASGTIEPAHVGEALRYRAPNRG